jgi:hypothetical protein
MHIAWQSAPSTHSSRPETYRETRLDRTRLEKATSSLAKTLNSFASCTTHHDRECELHIGRCTTCGKTPTWPEAQASATLFNTVLKPERPLRSSGWNCAGWNYREILSCVCVECIHVCTASRKRTYDVGTSIDLRGQHKLSREDHA